MQKNISGIKGLSTAEVKNSKRKNGTNELIYKKENHLLNTLLQIVKEPMIIILMVAAAIYFLSGKINDGIFLTTAIILTSFISIYQNSRSKNALEKLKEFTKTKCKAIRNNEIIEIETEAIVLGDFLLVEEGTSINADGTVIQSNDFSVNESILTGEFLSINKSFDESENLVYRGTSVSSGSAIIQVKDIGNETKLGKIGKSLESIVEEKTPLEIQINHFIKIMVIAGVIVFGIVWAFNFFQTKSILEGLLKSLTIAMSVIPEEIPVAFTTFMALGAWRLMKKGIVVKEMKTVETLGSATVICTDKTGTLTENKMTIAKVFSLSSNSILLPTEIVNQADKDIIELAMWASEIAPFDTMEIAIHNAYNEASKLDKKVKYNLTFEYPLEGKPPMMTHVFEAANHPRIIATKGALEAIMAVSTLTEDEKKHIELALQALTQEGYRIIAVAQSDFTGNNYPKTQQELKFKFMGILAFYDPPKKNISEVLQSFYKAGIKVKIITGDSAETTQSIAKQIGFLGYEKSISGDELMKLSDSELKKKVEAINLYTRMFPEAKLRIINALKANKEIVAMTGDGVNDGPALKASHIGIAMGKKGTEIAKQAASLILVNDDLSKMVEAIGMGRKIYQNLKKAIRYIVSIHIPIILTVFIPLALGWKFPNIFSPIHVIFLELIMGPTCSIIYENEPMEKNAMTLKPRLMSANFFKIKELGLSLTQGLIITAGLLFVYQYSVRLNYAETLTRTMIFATLIAANIFLTLANRSFYYSILSALKFKNNLVVVIIGITLGITAMIIYIPLFARFFEFQSLSLMQVLLSILIAFISVIWVEIYKWFLRKNTVILKQ